MPADTSDFSNVTLRPLTQSDFDFLVQWINSPHVRRWWDEGVDMQSVVAKYGPRLEPNSPTRVFIIEVDSKPVGMIQCYRHEDYPDWDRVVGIESGAGIDYLIGDPDFTGKGIGTQAIKQIVAIAFELYPDIDVVLSVPQKDNRPSWRALEKAGLKRIDERKLDSGCPSDAGLSYIYIRPRND